LPFRQSPDYLLISQAAAAAFAAARLLHFRLQRRYPYLFTFLLVNSILSIILSLFDVGSVAYYWAFIFSDPAVLLSAVFAVWEMFALVFRDYPGLRTAGRWALYAALGVAAVAGTAGTFMSGGESRHLTRIALVFAIDRTVSGSLAVIITILMLFLSRYPLRLERNTYVASGFFSAIFLAQVAVRLLDSRSQTMFVRYADYAEVGFTALCFLGWGIMLQRAEAPRERTPVHKPREAELLQQLETLNGILSRSVHP
jgi:hypothetical protein